MPCACNATHSFSQFTRSNAFDKSKLIIPICVHTANSKQPSLQPARPSYNPKLAPSPPAPSPPYLILQSLSTLPTFFGSSYSVVSVWTSHSQHVLVGAVALSTLLATTARHVLSQESYDPEEAPSKGQQHASAEKEGPKSR